MKHKYGFTYSTFTFFWAGLFSQWKYSPFVDPESKITFTCAEQYMMAQKALMFNDIDIFNQIMATDSPREHQTLGRKVKGFDKARWDIVKEEIVFRGNWLKFSSSTELKAKLIATVGTLLVEASPRDRVWGIGMKAGDPGIEDPVNWRGENLLGLALTRVREKIVNDMQREEIAKEAG